MGSNRGAYVKLGPDLVPYMIQYQANSMTRELSVRQRYHQPTRKRKRENELIGLSKVTANNCRFLARHIG